MENLMAKEQAKVWEMPSSSSSKTYQTIQYTDGYVSCNCPGWTRRAIRECKHTNMVHMGTADIHSISMSDLMQKKANPTPVKKVQTVAPKAKTPKKKKADPPAAVVRKIHW